MKNYFVNCIYSYEELDKMFEEVVDFEMEYIEESGEVIDSGFWRGKA